MTHPKPGKTNLTGLNFLVGKSILNPIKEMIRSVSEVRDGNFHQKVQVISNDELGVLGDGMNEMTEGLIERDRMRHSLNLAKEIQQALLPQTAPEDDMTMIVIKTMDD